MKHYWTDTRKKWGMIRMAFLACMLWHPACVSCLLAEGPVKYLAFDEADGSLRERSQADCVILSGTETTLSDGGWFLLNRDIEFSKRPNVAGTVHLILGDGCTLTALKGIHVGQGSTLYIHAQSADKQMGRLIARSNANYVAGIGGNKNEACGNVLIDGGDITASASGYYYAAGIGGGFCGSWGHITLHGGIVRATGGDSSAGIGGGYFSDQLQKGGGTITITGGTVLATSGKRGAAIGGGFMGCGGHVSISGGQVTAQAADNESHGIGAGGFDTGIPIVVQSVRAITPTDMGKLIADSPISLSWTDSHDFIRSDNYYGPVTFLRGFYLRGTATPASSENIASETLVPYITGDVDKSGTLTIADVTALVNILLGKTSADYNPVAGDLDQNGSITIADVTILVNLLLGK